MLNQLKTIALFFSLIMLASTHATAALVGDHEKHIIFKKIEQFNVTSDLNISLTIDEAGIYLATLTDFENPSALKSLGLDIANALGSLGGLNEAGSFTFEANVGEHFLTMFAIATGKREAQKVWLSQWQTEKLNFFQSLSRTEKEVRSVSWWALTDKERRGRYQRSKARQITLFEEQFSSHGEYGVEIEWYGNTVVNPPEAVPIPGAVWLFGSGLLGLIGVSRSRRKN